MKSRGYCYRCYPIILRLEKTRAWDPSRPETLRHYPKWGGDIALPSGENLQNRHGLEPRTTDFPKIKAHTIQELQKRLLHFGNIEEKLSGPISGYDLELLLRRVARQAAARDRHLLSGIATAIEWSFNHRQRKLLFEWLSEILDNVRWRGINSWGWMRR